MASAAAIFPKQCRFRLLVGALCIPFALAGGSEAVVDTWWNKEFEYTFLEVMVTILMLWLALAFEAFWHYVGHDLKSSYQYGKMKSSTTREDVHHHDRDHHHSISHVQLATELVNRAGAEFMTLGFLASIIFAWSNAGAFAWCLESFPTTSKIKMPKTEADWLHLAEFVHFQLFLAMLLYFVLMARVVKGSVERIKYWEECSEGHIKEGQLSHPMGWDLAVYRCWREYFITKMVSWQVKRPSLFKELLEKLDIDDEAPDVSPQFKDVLTKEFEFGAYLALCVASGVTDSIQVHPLTWFMVLLVFAFYALMNWYAEVPLSAWTPGIIASVIGCLLAMWATIARKRRFVEHVILNDDASQGHVVTQREASNISKSSDPEHKRFHERHHTELIMLRGLQVVVFLLSYEWARMLLDVHDWTKHPGMHALYCGLFLLLFLVLAAAVPSAVPMFLGIMALPPYVHHSNFATFRSVLLKNRSEKEIQVLRKLTTNLKSRDISRLGSGLEGMENLESMLKTMTSAALGGASHDLLSVGSMPCVNESTEEGDGLDGVQEGAVAIAVESDSEEPPAKGGVA